MLMLIFMVRIGIMLVGTLIFVKTFYYSSAGEINQIFIMEKIVWLCSVILKKN